ncbi:MAG: hypothetical protein QOC93_3757 [Actinomycetota bacterium]|nr:hypothetical protein [Actinomycetota bacterium]
MTAAATGVAAAAPVTHRTGPGDLAARVLRRSRFLTTGSPAVFTPGRTGVLVRRRVANPEYPEIKHSELFVYRLSDGRTTPLLSPGGSDVDGRLRYSPDGRSIWMLVQVWGEPSFELMQYGLAEDRILRTTGTLGGEYGCSDFELLPSGTRVVLTCGPRQVWTVRLDTGAVTRRTTVVPANAGVDSVRGRLSAGTLLVSGYTRSSSGARTSWLGALDLRTFTMRWLPGSSGSGRGVTEY